MDLKVKSLKVFSNILRKRLASTYGLADLYQPSINRNKDKLIEFIKEKASLASRSDVAQKMRDLKAYYYLEMAPPTSTEELAKLKADFALAKEFLKRGCIRFLTVRQAWLLFLVTTEVYLWFFLGETIGKMHIVGYKV